MKINKLFLYSLLALTASCNQEELVVVEKPTAGEEVQFGMSLDKNSITRTIYGEESDNKFPIYWENGDEVQVVSPQCMQGRNQAGYKVLVNGASQDYANSLTKIGDTGIQWGDTEDANFYSIYPRENVSKTVFADNDATFTITMPTEQNILLEDVGNQPTMKRPEMEACFMYAGVVGPNVEGTKAVNLTYKPLSTAIRFRLTGPTATHASSGDVIVSKIVLTAPTGTAITGEFTTKVSVSKDENGTETLTATVTPVTGNTSNEVTIYSHYNDGTNRGYLTLKERETIDMCAFVMLKENTDFSTWKMTIHLASGATFTKTLTLTGDVTNNTLVARKVNKVPPLPEMYNSTSDWNPANWMVNIPRNVYLSEISIPGSWNSLNDDSQGSEKTDYDIATQYANGIRAFHIDTRWKRTGNYGNYQYTLGTADGYSSTTGSDGSKYMTGSDNLTFEESLSKITAKSVDNEYMVVFVTFAQGSADHNRADGGWQKAVLNACQNNDKVLLASDIDANTVVGEVLGKVIVFINSELDMTDETTKTQTNGSKTFYANVPMILTSELTDEKINSVPIYYGGGTSSGISLYHHHAQVMSMRYEGQNSPTISNRGYAPSFEEREAEIDRILAWSNTNYASPNYSHNSWIYLGLGGYYYQYDDDTSILDWFTGWEEVSDSHDDVATRLNKYIDDKIKNMTSRPDANKGQTSYFPVGIVLMNYTHDHTNVIKNILQLNTKYRQAYDPNWDPDNADKAKSDVKSVATGYSSGMVDNNTNAMGWD